MAGVGMAMAVGAASAAIKLVMGHISSAIGTQVMLRWNLNKDLKKMKSALESVEAVLEDAERHSIKDKLTRLWLQRLTDAMYEIYDMIDDFEADSIKSLDLTKGIIMANKLKNMRKRLNEITEQHKSLNFVRDTRSSVQQVSSDYRETCGAVEEEKIVGRTNEKQEIITCLSGGAVQQNTTFLPIYGIGGIGKTTLAQMVFNPNSKITLGCGSVSQTFDLKNVGNSIISQLLGKEEYNQGLQMIHKRLGELFAAKKTLIILDDLWEGNPFRLDDLKIMLKQGEGSKVIVMVTTRDESIARQICTVEPYKLDPLTKEVCWDIIKQKCDFEARPDKERLKAIGEQIANKCGGVALADHSLGHMLKFMLYEQWLSMRDDDIWNLRASEDTSTHHVVLTSLLLSYSCMPPYLRLCFGYCGIFPKGCRIPKNDLIHQWIALGLIDPSSILSTEMLAGEDYVRKLMAMCFLQHPKIFYGEDVEFLTMHDLVHDLARAVMSDEVDINSSRCRYAYVTDSTGPLKSSKIRALHFVGHSDQLHGYVSAAKYLRILDLRACDIEELPDCVGQLKQLRYLNAPHINDQMIPTCITKLSKLNYLNLGKVRSMQQAMRQAKLAKCGIKKKLPGSFVGLRELVHLNLSNNDDVLGISEALVGLTKLQHLNLSWCYGLTGLPEALGGLTKLQHLNLSGCSGLTGLPEVISNLSELRYLNLSHCMYSIFDSSSTDQTSFIECIFTLPNMKHLDLSCNEYHFSIPESAIRLSKLNLGCCSCITEIPESVVKMDRRRLFGLLPWFSVHADDGASSSNFILLQHVNPDELVIACLENVKSPEEAHNISLSEKQRTEKLSFAWTEDSVRFVEDMLLLTELKPPTTLKGLRIRGYNSVSFPDWLMGGNICTYLPNIVRVEMEDVPNCKILPPALGQLKNLQELVLLRMESVEEWNTACSCGEDGVNEFMFPKLKQLTIFCCPKLRIKPHPPRADSWSISGSDNVLTSWPESVSCASSSSAAVNISLEIEDSKVPLRNWRLLHHLPALGDLTIQSCNDLTSSPEITQALSSLKFKSLTLEAIGKTGPLEWLGELTSLQCLTIDSCLELKGLHENTRQLTQLQSLELSYCDSMTSLPQWLGELASLEKLRIFDCPAIRSLPESIQQLTNLQDLVIRSCDGLKQWCSSEENMLKLAHIKKKDIRWPEPATPHGT